MRWWYAVKQAASFILTLFRMLPLWWRNRLSVSAVPTDGDVVISLTTHGHRLNKVYLTIESLIWSTDPAPIVLWLDERDFVKPLPPTLERQVKRGLQIRCSPGMYGPHTKYYPQFVEEADSHRRVATADDDMIYPHWWLEKLKEIADLVDNRVVCYRAHRIELRKGTLAPYAKWSAVNTTQPSQLHFATGVSGVLYPRAFIAAIVARGEEFMEHCPKADDIWLHHTALREGLKIRQIFAHQRDFAVLPNTQMGALLVTNTLMGGNDDQIANTYTAEDIALLTQIAATED